MPGPLQWNPKVLVLDEPTAGLDPKGIHDLLGFISDLKKSSGMTVIFSTHDVSLVPEIADYIYVMNKGRIVAQGTVEEVFFQTELLKSVRLDVPLYPKLIKSLRDKGIPVSMAFTFEEAEKAFLEAFKGRS